MLNVELGGVKRGKKSSKSNSGIDGITQKMLLEQLKEPMDYGFVEKKSYEGYPLYVEYSLKDGMGMEIPGTECGGILY